MIGNAGHEYRSRPAQPAGQTSKNTVSAGPCSTMSKV